MSPFDAIETPHRRFVLISRWLFPALFAGHLFFAPSTKFHITIYPLIGWDIRNHRICHQFVKMQIRGRKPKKQPIRAGGISAPPPQATRGCAARLSRLRRSLSRLRRLLVRAKPNNTARYAGYEQPSGLLFNVELNVHLEKRLMVACLAELKRPYKLPMFLLVSADRRCFSCKGTEYRTGQR